MGTIDGILLAVYAAMLIWALRNFKVEVDEIKHQWQAVRGHDPFGMVKYRALRDFKCWLIVIAMVLLSLTGIGAAISVILGIVLVFRLLKFIEVPNAVPFIHSIAMFMLDFFFTTGGAGIVPLGAVFANVGGFRAGVAVVIVSNVMSHLFFLPKKNKKAKVCYG